MTQFEYTLWYVLLICEDYKIPTGEPLYIVCMSVILLLNNGEFPIGSKTWDNFTFYSWKDLSLQLFGSVRKKKKCKTIEFKSINYLRPWRGVEYHAILCTGFFHPVLSFGLLYLQKASSSLEFTQTQLRHWISERWERSEKKIQRQTFPCIQ